MGFGIRTSSPPSLKRSSLLISEFRPPPYHSFPNSLQHLEVALKNVFGMNMQQFGEFLHFSFQIFPFVQPRWIFFKPLGCLHSEQIKSIENHKLILRVKENWIRRDFPIVKLV